MSAIHELRESLLVTESAQFVTTMLRDISATRLQSIRAVFDANRAYYNELHSVTSMVQAYAATHAVELPPGVDGVGEVFVAVTSNKRFYGHINKAVITEFAAKLAAHPEAAGVVIGQTGQQLLARADVTRPVSTYSFAGAVPETAEIMHVIETLHPYQTVQVIHPHFVNSFTQTVAVTDVTHRVTPQSVDTAEGPLSVEYLYEPDIAKMLHFFRTQIRFVLFDRALLETRLALTGARLMKMQRARERAKELVKRERREIHKAVSSIKSMRLLETFTGFKTDRSL